jgi:hypothetical protein
MAYACASATYASEFLACNKGSAVGFTGFEEPLDDSRPGIAFFHEGSPVAASLEQFKTIGVQSVPEHFRQ